VSGEKSAEPSVLGINGREVFRDVARKPTGQIYHSTHDIFVSLYP